jgi:putative radical SAM enzyme (TIGR03279 family)
MTLFSEIDWNAQLGGRISAILPGSVAADVGLQPGDELLAINENPVEDVIDVQFYAAEEYLELLVRRGEEYFIFEAEREYEQALGIEFSHPTFDTDIRRCNNLCEFCFVLQMAPRFRRTLYIKDDDYRYSFLFGHFVTLTNLADHDWWRIETMRLSPLYISVHVTDLSLRREFLRNPTAPDIMDQLIWLAERDIHFHTQLVVVPEFNDGEWLARSISDLARLWPAIESISVVPVGLTKHHKYRMRTHTVQEAAATLAYVESLQSQFLGRFGIRFVYPTDEWYLVAGRDIPPLDAYDGQALHENGLGLVRNFLDEWTAVRSEIVSWLADHSLAAAGAPSAVTLATGRLFSETLRATAGDFSALTGIPVSVETVVNQRLGETITAAGLLMAEDIVAHLQHSGCGELVVLPRVVFDHPDLVSLDDLSPQEVANRLSRPVALADVMGDVWDAVTGQSAVLYRPAP